LDVTSGPGRLQLLDTLCKTLLALYVPDRESGFILPTVDNISQTTADPLSDGCIACFRFTFILS
jgi:hypothetical protein